MLAVTSSALLVVLQPASSAARLTNASARARVGSLVMGMSSSRPSVENEAVLAVVAGLRTLLARLAVDLVQAAEQVGGRIGGVGKAVVGPRQVLLRDRARDVGRHDHHQFGLAVDVVAALEQRAQSRTLHQAGEPADLVLGLLLDPAGARERAARGNFDGRFGAPRLDRRDRL